MPVLRILCYNGGIVTWTFVSLTTVKFRALILSMSLSYITGIFIPMIFYDICLFPAQFCYIIVYIRKDKVNVNLTLRLAVYQESIHLGIKSFETWEEIFFFN
jgi:hypothetical protein